MALENFGHFCIISAGFVWLTFHEQQMIDGVLYYRVYQVISHRMRAESFIPLDSLLYPTDNELTSFRLIQSSLPRPRASRVSSAVSSVSRSNLS